MTHLSTDNGIQMSVISTEEENYLRIANLMINVAPSAVRVKFNKEFNLLKLKEVLNKDKYKILDPLRQKRVINQAQWDLLFPVAGYTSSEYYDLTLMISLIKHLASTQIGDHLPFTGDKSDGADLTRLKYYRNIIMHSNNVTLSVQDFNKMWDEISQAVVRLGGSRFQERCEIFKVRKLDSNDKEVITEIRNIARRTLDPVPMGLREICDKTTQEWKNEKYAQTRAIIRLEELIVTDNVAVAVGPSGCGKSTAMHYIALKLAQKQHYDIIIVYTPAEIIQYYGPGCKQVFVIENVLGAASFDENIAEQWLNRSDQINKILNGNQVKLLFSCKTHIFQHRLVKTIDIFSNCCCDFLSSDYCLTDDERQTIASFYLSNGEIELLKSAKAFSTFNFFPVLCRLYRSQMSRNIVDYFSNPVKVVGDELLMTGYDQTTFGTLFLFIVYNNSIMDSLFTDKSKIKPILEKISDNLELKAKLSIQVVKREMEKLLNSYLKKQNTAYTIIHDTIFDVFVCFCGKTMFDLILDVAHTDIIRDRFVLKRLLRGNDKNKNVVQITIENEEKYLERLKKDSEQGFIQNVFSNRNLNDKSFRSKLIAHIGNETIDSLTVEMVFSLLMSMVDCGFCDIVSILLTKEINVDQNHWDGETPLFKSARRGYTDVVELLLKKNANPNFPACLTWLDRIKKMYPGITVKSNCNTYEKSSRYSPPPLPSYQIDSIDIDCDSIYSKYSNSPEPTYWNVPKYRNVPIPNERSNQHSIIVQPCKSKHYSRRRESRSKPFKAYNISPLHVAANGGFTDIVKLLLSHGTELDYITESQQIASPLYIAVNQGYTKIVQVLLEKKPCHNAIVPKHLHKCLHEAVVKGCYDIVKILLNYKIDVKQNQDHLLSSTLHVKFRMSLVDIAITKGHYEIVKLLLDQSCISNFCNENDVPLLFQYICEGKTEVVKLLLEQNIDPDTCYKNKESPLYRATSLGHIEIVKLLLEHNSNPNICNQDKISPLYVAAREGNIEILGLLLNHNSDPNMCNMDKHSVLHLATRNGRADIVKLLLQHEVKSNACDVEHQSALYIASYKRCTEIVKLLLDYNSDPNICNKNNKSPLYVA